jgi:hypothetical protein
MRTTVTLDEDVMTLLKTVVKERGIPFKEALNAAVRAGLSLPSAPSQPFVQTTYSMGADPYFRWEKALSVAEALEDEELSRKLALGK